MQGIEQIYPSFEPKLIKQLKKLPITEVKAGMDVVMKGMHADHIPLGIEGEISVYGKDEDGRIAELYTVQPGVACIISFTSAMSGNAVPTYSTCKTDAKVIMIPKAKSDKWFLKYPSWRNYVINLYNKRLTELVEQHENVVKQKDEIEYQNNQIIESINYAKKIQKAILPNQNEIKEYFAEHFIFYRPKDIVSGDFYWTKKEEDRIFFCAADATGHGVPGAFMSMLGISLMNEISFNFKGNAAVFLNKMREKIKEALKQSEHSNDAPRDGFDMQLCIFYPKTGEMDFAGGNNNLLICRNGELLEIKADRMPVGVYFREKKTFTNNTLKMQDNDVVYLSSDGYRDQFGGEQNHKFSIKRFKNLLKEISVKGLEEQKKTLENEFDNWKKDIIQIDDVLVMGVKISIK